MTRLDDVGEADGWRCWLCDEPVDPDRSVNDDRGPSVDARTTKAKSKKKSAVATKERLAHRACNTKKGAVEAVVRWPDDLFLVDPAPIITTVERLERKGGREAMGRCLEREDAERTAAWLLDRLSRLQPDQSFTTTIEEGGGSHLVVLHLA